MNYYDSLGVQTKQGFIKLLRTDGYDTVAFRTEIKRSGKKVYGKHSTIVEFPPFYWMNKVYNYYMVINNATAATDITISVIHPKILE